MQQTPHLDNTSTIVTPGLTAAAAAFSIARAIS